MSDHLNIYAERKYENQGFQPLVDLVLPEHHRILDVGCGNGANLYLLSQRGHKGVGLTLSEVETQLVTERGFECVTWDIMAEQLPFEEQTFDALIFSHVLEHLPWPEVVIKRYLKLLRPGGGVYVALPNALNLVQRWHFLCGNFNYTETGVMDRTHLRFYDFFTARQLLENVGLEIEKHIGIGQIPLWVIRRCFPILSAHLDSFISKRYPTMFAIHSIVVGRLNYVIK